LVVVNKLDSKYIFPTFFIFQTNTVEHFCLAILKLGDNGSGSEVNILKSGSPDKDKQRIWGLPHRWNGACIHFTAV